MTASAKWEKTETETILRQKQRVILILKNNTMAKSKETKGYHMSAQDGENHGGYHMSASDGKSESNGQPYDMNAKEKGKGMKE